VLVRPADVAAVEELFGPAGASNGCWCQYWLLGSGYKRRGRDENRRDLARQVSAGGAGLVAVDATGPVGWVRTSPRSTLPWLTRRFRSHPFEADDPPVLSCFFVARRARGTGVTRALVAAAVERTPGPLEAYPVDPSVDGATRNRFPGVLPVFLDAGFTERGRLAADRVAVRRD
jgi:GNAT superfamily N-acetyltransferase